jgi:predicted ATPase
MQDILRAMSSDEHPIILFIDDTQWMDKGSRQLLGALLKDDTELRNVMIMLAYRGEEVDKLEGFISEALLSRGVDVRLSNLQSTAVHHMVSAAFKARSEHTLKLSDLIMEKINGNAFHVKQFIETIMHSELAVLQRGTWVFHIQRIQDKVGISQTLSELLSQNIQRAPRDPANCSINGFSLLWVNTKEGDGLNL